MSNLEKLDMKPVLEPEEPSMVPENDCRHSSMVDLESRRLSNNAGLPECSWRSGARLQLTGKNLRRNDETVQYSLEHVRHFYPRRQVLKLNSEPDSK